MKKKSQELSGKSVNALKARIGESAFHSRMSRQTDHRTRLTHQGEGFFKLEKFISVDDLAEFCLRVSFLWKRAHENIFRIETNVVEWTFDRLPASFNNFRILQLSDLHIDIDPGLSKCIADKVATTEHDLLVITGDYRNSTNKDHSESMRAMKPVIEASTSPRLGILGNHDFLEMVADLEDAGLPVLLNESVPLTRGSESLWIAGVDDPHFYRTHDLARARASIPADGFSILLCHSPESHQEAASLGFDLMLSGHTHGGQICLPDGRHIVCPVRKLSRQFVKGRWVSGGMPGYTSKGTGSSGVAARLNCYPEISLHVLKRS